MAVDNVSLWYLERQHPRAGAAAVIMGGAYGHVMYVESVNGDGTITVSDYNGLGWSVPQL